MGSIKWKYQRAKVPYLVIILIAYSVLMQKDFDGWNEIKKQTNVEQVRLYTVREIWWCQFGTNIGTEQDGRGERYLRPGLILRGFGPDACLIAPLTTSLREHPLRLDIGLVDGKQAHVNLSQIRMIDTRRLVEKIGFLDKERFIQVRKTLRGMF